MTRTVALAFTLIELLVVITIIVVLLALLAPALDQAIDQTQRVVCATNQKTIHGGATQYALENKSTYFICRGREVEATFVTATDGPEYSGNSTDHTVDWLKAMSTVGLAASEPIMARGGKTVVTQEPLRPPGKMWYCPSTDYKGFWDSFWRQYWTAYHYYGGVGTWRPQLDPKIDPNVGVPSRSPVKLNKSAGSWALTSDRTVLLDKSVWSKWEGAAHPYWSGLPNHRRTEGRGPQGNNESFVDGSVAWIDGRDLLNIHSYRHDGNVIGFFYQSDLGTLNLPDGARAETYMD